MSKLYFFGTTGGCLDAFYLYKEIFDESDDIYFLSNDHNLGQKLHGYSVAGPFEMIDNNQMDTSFFVYQCGSSANHTTRHIWFEKALKAGMTPKTLVSDAAYIHQTASIGAGCIIYPGVKVMANVNIGTNCIILPNTVINHDSIIGDFCILNSSCVINGNVYIGRNAYIGSNTSIKEKISICNNVTVGMGSNVLQKIDTKGIYFGSPAKLNV
jgi:sugar O-acyltransferase (sialic acid O-acetyltransferase NeuD family)